MCLFEKNESFMKLQKCAIIDKDSCAGKPPGSQEMKDCYRECENKYSKNSWRRDSAKAKEICFEKEKCTEEYMPERPFYE